MNANRRGPLVAGIFFVVVGVLFLLHELDVVDLRPSIVLPLVLIGLGVAILVGTVNRSSR